MPPSYPSELSPYPYRKRFRRENDPTLACRGPMVGPRSDVSAVSLEIGLASVGAMVSKALCIEVRAPGYLAYLNDSPKFLRVHG